MRIKRKIRKIKISPELTIVERGDVILSENEMINLKFKNKKNEIVRKNWGFYLTPSINVRLKKNGFKCALIKNLQNKFFICLVLNSKKSLKNFMKYLKDDKQKLIMFFDEKKLKKIF